MWELCYVVKRKQSVNYSALAQFCFNHQKYYSPQDKLFYSKFSLTHLKKKKLFSRKYLLSYLRVTVVMGAQCYRGFKAKLSVVFDITKIPRWEQILVQLPSI
jgi:hypothetical protein